MNKPRCTDLDYIQFLTAAHGVYSATEAARSQPAGKEAAHDAYTRLLHRLPPDSAALWEEVKHCITPSSGLLVIDDTTLDKPYASKMELVTSHWSGKHGAVVQGINLISLVWTDGDLCMPCDYRIYDKADGLTKNDHFRTMLSIAKQREFKPSMVIFDSWYSSLENLKLVRDMGWTWLTRLKSNRQVSLEVHQHTPISGLDIPRQGIVVHLRGYGQIRVFRLVDPHGNTDFWATNVLTMTQTERQLFAGRAWLIENYHRDIKQFVGIERGQFRKAVAQRNYIGLALRAYLRLEWQRWQTLISVFHTKHAIIRDAVRLYRTQPYLDVLPTA
ncbi:transposase [bacterium]|nr:transposase [bacterium]